MPVTAWCGCVHNNNRRCDSESRAATQLETGQTSFKNQQAGGNMRGTNANYINESAQSEEVTIDELSKTQLNHNTTAKQPNTIQRKLGLT